MFYRSQLNEINMVLSSHQRFVFSKCLCGTIKRGCQFKKHLSSGDEHKKDFSFRACLHHREVMQKGGEEEFYKAHKECPSEKLAGATLHKWLEEVVRQLENERAVEFLNAEVDKIPDHLEDTVSSLSSSDSHLSRITESSEVAARIVAKRPSVDLDVTVDVQPTHNSTPKKMRVEGKGEGIKSQMFGWNRDVEISKVSQRHSLNQLTDKVKCLEMTNKRLLQENEQNKIKLGTISIMRKELDESRVRERELLDERRVNKDKVERAERIEREMNEKLSELKRLRDEVKEIDGMRAELNVLREDRKKLDMMKECAKMRRYDVHIPVKGNNLADTPILYEQDLNTTQDCYGCHESGVVCLHGNVECFGELRHFSIRKYRKIDISK